jgi:hypothetical protein
MSLVSEKPALIHRLYIDDSGEKEYGEKTSRYFVYAGVVLAANKEASIVGELTAAKQRTFGTPDVELKSNWLRIPREREKHYIKPYGVSDGELTAFVDWLWGWIKDSDLSLVAAVIDKTQMQARYANPWHPSATGYQFLLQRYQKHLERAGAWGQVTVDSMDGASPALNQWRDLLRNQHRRLKKDGCSITKLRFTHVADELRFGNSARFNQLQIADLTAYNVFGQFRDYGER